MADTTITGLTTELLTGEVDGDNDLLEIDDTSAVETKKVKPRALLVGKTGATVGAAGNSMNLVAGQGAAGSGVVVSGNGGDLLLAAGTPGATGGAGTGTPGGVEIAVNGESLFVENDGGPAALRPDVDNTWDLGEAVKAWRNIAAYTVQVLTRVLTPTGSVGAPSVAVGGLTEGLFLPAADQLGLTANGEAIIVDNDAASPALRPDADNTWDLGEGSFAWATVHAYILSAATSVLAPVGSVGAPSVAVGSATDGLFRPAANQLGLATNGEAIIVDNDGATPSLRPDVDATWDFGENALGWKDVYSDTWKVPGTSGQHTISGVAAAGVWAFYCQYAAASELAAALQFGLVNDGDTGLQINCEVDQSAAESYSGLLVKVTETALGSGTKSPLRVLAGAAGTTELLRLDNQGTLRPAGCTEEVHDEDEVTGQTTTSATLEDIPGLTFDLVLPVAGRIVAEMNMSNSSSGGGTVVGGWAISINAVDMTEGTRSLSGVNDEGLGSVRGWADLAAGTWTVKGRHRRVSGATTVNTDVAQLIAQFYPT